MLPCDQFHYEGTGAQLPQGAVPPSHPLEPPLHTRGGRSSPL